MGEGGDREDTSGGGITKTQVGGGGDCEDTGGGG